MINNSELSKPSIKNTYLINSYSVPNLSVMMSRCLASIGTLVRVSRNFATLLAEICVLVSGLITGIVDSTGNSYVNELTDLALQLDRYDFTTCLMREYHELNLMNLWESLCCNERQ